MTEDKGLDPIVADKIGEYVKLKGENRYSFPMFFLHLTAGLIRCVSFQMMNDTFKR